MSDRIFAIAWLGVCLLIAVQMWNLVVPFSYEPVGPKAFPALLAMLMALCCAVLLIQPDNNARFPVGPLLQKGVLLIGVLLLYALLFERIGFLLATAAMVLAVARLFGGSWNSSAISAVLIAVLVFVVFDSFLEVSLPTARFPGAG
jgi:putative tricarboxylic transport membrane protein